MKTKQAPGRILRTGLGAPPTIAADPRPSRACAGTEMRRGGEPRTSPALHRMATYGLLCLIFARSLNADVVPAGATKAVDTLMTNLYERGQFKGSILVAVEGNVIYRNAFGEANSESHRQFTPTTPSNLASVSKQFTAMTVMMLAEQGKINYDDPVSKYIPIPANCVDGITIRHLLTHTSGIPDVGDFGIDHLTGGKVKCWQP